MRLMKARQLKSANTDERAYREAYVKIRRALDLVFINQTVPTAWMTLNDIQHAMFVLDGELREKIKP